MKNRRRWRHSLWLVGLLLASGCSTTKRLGSGEVLYTGVGKIEVDAVDSTQKLSQDLLSEIREPLSVKPNNPLWGARLRTPLPTGLWAYNSLYTEKTKGFRHWLYEKLAKTPIRVSDVQPNVRTGMVEDLLENRGYFGSTAGYTLLPRNNPKKARIGYHVEVAPPWTFSRISFPDSVDLLTRRIDSLREGSLLRVGGRFDIDTLSHERIRIANHLRNAGYYYFRPNYLEYLADSTEARREVDLRMILSRGIPATALRPYRIGQVRVELYNPLGGPTDSMSYRGMQIVYQKPLKIRPSLFQRSLQIAPGQLSRLDSINATLHNLTQLQIFRSVNLSVTPLDSLRGADSVDMLLSGAFDAPLEAEFEADFMSESNSFIGPGLIFGVRHKNIFRGGEVLGVHFNGNYEWQTGNSSAEANSSKINSYEFGLTGSLTFPRLLVPRFMNRREHPGHTRFSLNSDLLQRPKYFTMLSLGAAMTYDFQSSPHSSHSLSLVKLTYNNLLRTTADFDSTMSANPAMALSFENQFIPATSYTYTYDRKLGVLERNRLVWKSTLTPAGNLLAGIYDLMGSKGIKKIAGDPFSQFAKITTELKLYHRTGSQNNQLVARLFVGAGFAYGNSEVMPYSEQFYSGGSNSIRAFSSRSLGPGSYRAPTDDPTSYYDQTGDFKLEANLEYRFRIMGVLAGAIFIDAGNIWLLEDDPLRPGGRLNLKNFGDEIALGTGVGLRVDLGFLVVRTDLGVGIHTPYPNPDKPRYYNISSFKDGLGLHLAIDYPF